MKLTTLLQPRTLQQRNMFYIILPTMLILLTIWMLSLALVRKTLLTQWQEAAIAQMQRVAVEMDLSLRRPKRLLMLYQEQAGERFNRHVSEFILDRIRSMEGVIDVNLEWYDQPATPASSRSRSQGMGSMRFSRMKPLEVTTPIYDTEFKGPTISLVSDFRDTDDTLVGKVEVKVSFYDLVDKIVKSPWWQSNMAFLVDQNGNVLTHASLFQETGPGNPVRKFGERNELEKRTLAEFQEKDSGTVFGSGMPPNEVSGFFRLREAPWTIVLIAPGELVLKPLIEFRKHYLITGVIGIMVVLLLIKLAISGTAKSIRRVSDAARELAAGNFGSKLEQRSRDEVGELVHNFNIMTRQLQERMHLQEAMSVAREVQQNLLPQSSYQVEGIDINGRSLYCQETGGDYYDILPDRKAPERVSVVLGDVVGHGIGAALLMASIRAFVRCRTALPGRPVEVITDVNELLCRDTEKSGNFVTLFYLLVDRKENSLHWVRCGHDPAIVYDMETKEFSELRGEGLVLGFDGSWQYEENRIAVDGRQLVVLIGSDGVWEAESEDGEQFGRTRVEELIAANAHRSSEELTAIIADAVTAFRGRRPQGDDITLLAIKTV